MPAKHQVMGTISRTLMFRSIIRMDKRCYIRFPISLFVVFKRTQHIQQSLVESLALPVSLRMIRCSARFSNSCQITELSYKFRFKVSSLITMYPKRERIVLKKIFPKTFCCSLCRLVFSRKCLCIPSLPALLLLKDMQEKVQRHFLETI